MIAGIPAPAIGWAEPTLMTAYDIVQAAFEQQPEGSLARHLLGKIADLIEDADMAIETGDEA